MTMLGALKFNGAAQIHAFIKGAAEVIHYTKIVYPQDRTHLGMVFRRVVLMLPEAMVRGGAERGERVGGGCPPSHCISKTYETQAKLRVVREDGHFTCVLLSFLTELIRSSSYDLMTRC